MTLRIDTAELVAMLTDLVHTAGEPEAGAVGGVLLHTARGWQGVEPGRTALLVGTSTNRFAVGHTYTACSGSLPPMLWPVQDVKAVVAVLKPLAKEDHAVEIHAEDDQVRIIEDADLFGQSMTLTFGVGDLTKYPRQVWGVLTDVHVTVRNGADTVPAMPRTDISPAALKPFVTIATRRKDPLEVYRYHQRRPVLIQIGGTYRGAIMPISWPDGDSDGEMPSGEVWAPQLPEVDADDS